MDSILFKPVRTLEEIRINGCETMDYEIFETNGYNHESDVIYLGIYSGRYEQKELDADEETLYWADVLTHEHLHRAIFKATDNKVLCLLLDAIENKFRLIDDAFLKRFYKNDNNFEPHTETIKRHGFDYWLLTTYPWMYIDVMMLLKRPPNIKSLLDI